jgi:hypothetical protein
MIPRHCMAAFVLGGAVMAQVPAHAGAFNPPEGCTGFLTVQSRGCRVSNHYTCEKDAPGDQWRADFDQDGVFFVSRIDSEAQWVETFELFPSVRQTLDAGAEDPASFSELLETGADSFDFRLSKDNGARTHVTGYDRLTGKRVVIDGVPLQVTEFEFTETGPDGAVIHKSHGNEYVSEKWRLFFSGPTQWDNGDGPFGVDSSPVEFATPGAPGFFATEPKYDCDALMSSLPISRRGG